MRGKIDRKMTEKIAIETIERIGKSKDKTNSTSTINTAQIDTTGIKTIEETGIGKIENGRGSDKMTDSPKGKGKVKEGPTKQRDSMEGEDPEANNTEIKEEEEETTEEERTDSILRNFLLILDDLDSTVLQKVTKVTCLTILKKCKNSTE
jgi:hypothetical protein